jgi:hypothetical protein
VIFVQRHQWPRSPVKSSHRRRAALSSGELKV